MNDKKLKVVKYAGHEIHDYYVNNNAKNKINGIAYKLLNAIKVGNKRLYGYSFKNIYVSRKKCTISIYRNNGRKRFRF